MCQTRRIVGAVKTIRHVSTVYEQFTETRFCLYDVTVLLRHCGGAEQVRLLKEDDDTSVAGVVWSACRPSVLSTCLFPSSTNAGKSVEGQVSMLFGEQQVLQA